MTTKVPGSPEGDRRGRKALRVRMLTDPLGAMGQRRTRERVEREARARRTVFVAAFASFVAAFGLIAAGGRPAAEGTELGPEPSGPSAASGRVLAEVPVTDLIGADDGRETVIRIVAPESPPARAHVRTRSS